MQHLQMAESLLPSIHSLCLCLLESLLPEVKALLRLVSINVRLLLCLCSLFGVMEDSR